MKMFNTHSANCICVKCQDHRARTAKQINSQETGEIQDYPHGEKCNCSKCISDRLNKAINMDCASCRKEVAEMITEQTKLEIKDYFEQTCPHYTRDFSGDPCTVGQTMCFRYGCGLCWDEYWGKRENL